MAGKQKTSFNGLFVISGSHGVGKTTTLPLVADQLKSSGYSVRDFHHRLKSQNSKVAWKAPPSPPVTVLALKRTWRTLPKGMRLTVDALVDAYNYARKINQKVDNIRKSGSSALADRYVYDQLIDLSLRKRPSQQIFAFQLASRLMPRPSLTIILTDYPERIHSRNPELTISENAKYQDTLVRLLRSRKIPHQEVSVFRRTPEEVATEVSDRIISHLRSRSANK